jgi:hypothetical protein
MNQRPPNKDETTEGIKTMMPAVQVTRANGPFELVERKSRNPRRDRCASKSMRAAFAIAMR